MCRGTGFEGLTFPCVQGKKLLKEGNGASAMVRFEKALLLSRSSGK